MKALVHDGHGNIALLDRPRPRLTEPTDAIVRVTRSTICTSDLHIMRGAVPRAQPDTVLGHEFVGVVEEVGPGVRSFSPGDRVAVNCETFCGECFFCKHGWVNNCESGGWLLGCTIDGCQAEYARVPFADNAFTRIPDGVSDEDALFLGDILATGWWGARLAEIEPGSTVAVIGAGPVGLTTMMCARLANPVQVIALDVDESRLELARGHGLADVVINPAEKNLSDVESIVRAATHGRGADAVIEAAGGDDTFRGPGKTVNREVPGLDRSPDFFQFGSAGQGGERQQGGGDDRTEAHAVISPYVFLSMIVPGGETEIDCGCFSLISFILLEIQQCQCRSA